MLSRLLVTMEHLVRILIYGLCTTVFYARPLADLPSETNDAQHAGQSIQDPSCASPRSNNIASRILTQAWDGEIGWQVCSSQGG
jgi:hypothetical protein